MHEGNAVPSCQRNTSEVRIHGVRKSSESIRILHQPATWWIHVRSSLLIGGVQHSATERAARTHTRNARTLTFRCVPVIFLITPRVGILSRVGASGLPVPRTKEILTYSVCHRVGLMYYPRGPSAVLHRWVPTTRTRTRVSDHERSRPNGRRRLLHGRTGALPASPGPRRAAQAARWYARAAQLQR